MYHVVQDLFRYQQKSTTDSESTIKISCLEIYADELRDLLIRNEANSTPTYKSPLKKPVSLKFRDHGEHVTIQGLHEIVVRTTEEVYDLLHQVQHQRTTCSTQLNEQSSRSHAIYVFTIITKPYNQNATETKLLTFVDLAGSERIKDSCVTGMNRKESIHINTDLFVLGKVISSLHEHKVHVPYRDSKLTRLLRNSLGGGNNHCRTIFIACVSPAEAHIDETLHTLRYAERARSIENSGAKSFTQSDESSITRARINALQEENAILRARITNLTRRQVSNDFSTMVGRERGDIKLGSIAMKLQLAKQEAATIRQHTTLHDKFHPNKMTQKSNPELELLCASLRQEVDFVNSENDILRLQTIRLQHEIKRLRDEKNASDNPVIDSKESSEGELNDELWEGKPEANESSEHDKIRLHAERLLNWVDEAIDKNRSYDIDPACSSASITSDGTYFRPLHLNDDDDDDCAVFHARNTVANSENEFYISNLKTVEDEASVQACPCRESVFSKRPDIVAFYLPKLGLVCTCGRKDTVPLIGSDPCRLENILRDWQVQFCESCNILSASDFLNAYTQEPCEFAKKMRSWRKANRLQSVKTKSCGIALRIWARTCKTVIKTMQNHTDSTMASRPDFLDVTMSSDSITVSTLGFGASSEVEFVVMEA
jgi:Kinesin motor domain